MKEFTHDDFKENELFKNVLDVSHRELCNSDYCEYFGNINYENLLNVLNQILNEFFLIYNKKQGVIKFKESFNRFKQNSIHGEIQFQVKDENKNLISYNSDFVFYSELIYWLFLRTFSDGIEDQEDMPIRIKDLLYNNYRELNKNPANYFIMKPISRIFRNSTMTGPDIRDYVLLFLNDIKEFEEEQKIKNPPFKDEIIKNKGLPKYNLPQRLYLLEKIKILDVIKASANDEKRRIELLAIIFNISIDNSRKLLSGTYGREKYSDKREIENYIDYYKIGIIK